MVLPVSAWMRSSFALQDLRGVWASSAGRKRLVHQQHGGIDGERTGRARRAAACPPDQLMGENWRAADAEADQLKQALRRRPALGRGDPLQLEAEARHC